MHSDNTFLTVAFRITALRQVTALNQPCVCDSVLDVLEGPRACPLALMTSDTLPYLGGKGPCDTAAGEERAPVTQLPYGSQETRHQQ
ncbi:hypothetical protein P7K49_008968, partial [Saguinus oedipus]